jgi:S-adenosylmethionine:tRNA ribosyltransferase-isomerase
MPAIDSETPHRLSDFSLDIPERLIAQSPVADRDRCRLMVLDRASKSIENHHFYHLPDFINEGDVLVLNDTQVFPARLYAEREQTGTRIEVFLLRDLGDHKWEVLVKPGRKVHLGDTLVFPGRMSCKVLDHTAAGGRIVHFSSNSSSFTDYVDQYGKSPLPPYIHREPQPVDREAYQTVYARNRGAVAAPTAGLHFTPELLEQLNAKGVILVQLTLHVGLGTFRPVQEEDITRHRMDEEFYQISPESAEIIKQALHGGNRVVAVGTTSVRALETAATGSRHIESGQGWTDKFIYPPYTFNVVDGLITNFHQPRSSLSMLVSAFAGNDFLFDAYHQAVRDEYRFYSYGDAMLIM